MQGYIQLGLYGDYTKHQSGMFHQLGHIREVLAKTWGAMEPQIKAKCLFAIAYDYLDIELEEYTDMLVTQALTICPNYLEQYIVEHMRQNEDFAKIILYLDLYFQGGLGIMDEKE